MGNNLHLIVPISVNRYLLLYQNQLNRWVSATSTCRLQVTIATTIKKKLEMNATTQLRGSGNKMLLTAVKHWWAHSHASDIVNVFFFFVTISYYHMYNMRHTLFFLFSCIPFFMPTNIFALSLRTEMWLRLAVSIHSIESFLISFMNILSKHYFYIIHHWTFILREICWYLAIFSNQIW